SISKPASARHEVPSSGACEGIRGATTWRAPRRALGSPGPECFLAGETRGAPDAQAAAWLREYGGRRIARVDVRAARFGGVARTARREVLIILKVVAEGGVAGRNRFAGHAAEVGETGVAPPARLVVLDL